MKVTIPAQGWSPRPHQLGVWTDLEAGVKNLLLVAHRRWGKDEIGLNDCAINAAKTPANYFYCFPEQEHVRRSLWTSINKHTGKRRMDECFPEGFRIGNLKEQEMAIDVNSMNGKQSRIQFLGSDNYDAIVGGSPYGVYLSEWAICDPQALAMLRPIVEENGGYMRFLTTPRGRNHVWRQMKGMLGKDGWAVHYMNALDTNVFSAERLEALRQESVNMYGPDVGNSLFQQEYMCTFEDVTPGSYYIDLLLKLEKQGHFCGILPMEGEPVYAAFDIGYADAMAIWYAQVMRNNEVNLIGYEEFHKTSIPDTIKILRERTWFYGGLLLPHDGAHHEVTSGETCETLLTRAGFTCYVMPQTNDDAQIQSVRMMLPRCNFHEGNCERGITCLKHFHNRYKSETDSWSPKPVHDWSSHGAKAFATLAYFAPVLRRGAKGGQYAGVGVGQGEHDRPGGSQGGLGWMK